MDWDTITQTGARTSGVEEPTPRMAVHHRVQRPDTERGTRWVPRSARRADANLHDVQGMPGAGLTCATWGKALPERPTFQPYRGKTRRTVDRGDPGNGGIIRSPIRAMVLPDQSRPQLLILNHLQP